MDQITPQRVLVSVAHPDDIEYFCGGTLAKWIQSGCTVAYLIATSGDKGSNDPNANGDQLVRVREAEQRASAKILGVHDVTFLRLPDSELTFVSKDALRREIVRHIRRTQSQVVFTHDPLVRFTKQHPDHRAIGQLTMDASFPISDVAQCYREQLIEEGLNTCQPEFVLMFGTDQPNYWTDISETLDLKIRALKEHQSQENAFHGGIEARLRWKSTTVGQSHGLVAAEEFLMVRTGPTLPNSA